MNMFTGPAADEMGPHIQRACIMVLTQELINCIVEVIESIAMVCI